MEYEEVLKILFENSDEKRAIFNSKIIVSASKNLGVPSAITLDIAKRIAKEKQDVSNFPLGKYHEINLIVGISTMLRKDLSVSQKLDFLGEFFKVADNWAVVDSTAAKFKTKDFDTVQKYLSNFINSEYVYVRRFVYVTLLDNFVKPDYFNFINLMLRDDNEYYVQMAESWLISELAIKGMKNETIEVLTRKDLNKKIINKAISKICDSYRVSDDDKNLYRTYRVK